MHRQGQEASDAISFRLKKVCFGEAKASDIVREKGRQEETASLGLPHRDEITQSLRFFSKRESSDSEGSVGGFGLN